MSEQPLTREKVEKGALLLECESVSPASRLLFSRISEADAFHRTQLAAMTTQKEKAEHSWELWRVECKKVERESTERLNQINILTAKLAKVEQERDVWQNSCEQSRELVGCLGRDNQHLGAQLAEMTAERDEHKEMAEWFLALVPRANIGTEKTPSLRAYIEQIEQQLALARQALVKCRRELWHCNDQLKHRGANEGGSVTEALEESAQALREMGEAVVKEIRTTEIDGGLIVKDGVEL